MFKTPLVVEIENVVCLVKFKAMEDWDATKLESAFVEAQQSMLDQFEIKAKVIEETQNQQGQKGNSFVQTIIDRIINNLKISVKGIFFRFEDHVVDLAATQS